MHNNERTLLFATVLVLEAVGLEVAPATTHAAVLALFAAAVLQWLASHEQR